MLPEAEVPRGQGYKAKSEDIPPGCVLVARVITLAEGSSEEKRKIVYDPIFQNEGSLADDLFTMPVAEYHLSRGTDIVIFQNPVDVEDDSA